jgi:hypothetical protein
VRISHLRRLKKTIAELRDIAKDLTHDAVQGYTQMNKEHLLPAICKALGIDAHEHHAAALAQKTAIKTRLAEIKAARAKALTDGNHDLLRQLRRQYHRLNHSLRSSAVRCRVRSAEFSVWLAAGAKRLGEQRRRLRRPATGRRLTRPWPKKSIRACPSLLS